MASTYNNYKNAIFRNDFQESNFYIFFIFLLNQFLLGQISLSEFCPENKNSYSDPAGQYYDWIELYNSSTQAQSTKGLYLTDKFDKPDKWLLPELTIPPFGYLIIFASSLNTFENQHWHTNFSLDKDGEFIGLWSDQNYWIDSLSFGLIPTDYSFIKMKIIYGSVHIKPHHQKKIQ